MNKILSRLLAPVLLFPLAALNAADPAPTGPESGSQAEKNRNLTWSFTPDPSLPDVLILGDSISIGYTQQVRSLLKGKANVFRPITANGLKTVNCEGTTRGAKDIDQWLAGHQWKVIHFNFGLHDLKHVAPGTGQNSARSEDPVQATVEEYSRNLEVIVGKLKATGARLIFATTTPVPAGAANPLREPDAPPRYNAAARKIMESNGIRVNDLFALCEPQLQKLQLPKDVHFNADGCKVLAEQVAAVIKEELAAGVAPLNPQPAAQTQETLPHKWIPSIAPNPNPDSQWFRSAALGLFQHWGIVSGGTPSGDAWDMRVRLKSKGSDVPESDLLKNTVSPEKMFERAKVFNPDKYNPDHWMSAAKTAGFRYAVLTTRHHDAYFLGDSKFGDWHAGHYIGRDLIMPWAEACRKYGIKVGFYFSSPDWYHGREYMNYAISEDKTPLIYNWKHEKVDSLPKMPEKAYAEIKDIRHGQFEELLTRYGKIDLLWPDGGMSDFTIDEARKLQPGMIVGRGFEYSTPEGWDMMKMEYIKEANRRGYPWEFCTIGHGGSWHWSEKAEEKGISAKELISQLAQVRARGGNLLVNIAPRPDGEMPHWFYPLCEKMGEWMKTGAEAIYDVNVNGPFPYPNQCVHPVTVTPKAWYVFPNAKNDPIIVKDVGNPTSITLLRDGQPVPFEYAGRQLTIRIPKELRTDMPDVVKITWEKAKE